nr:hypothetical protein [Pseudoxanthomonas taiwanensis]
MPPAFGQARDDLGRLPGAGPLEFGANPGDLRLRAFQLFAGGRGDDAGAQGGGDVLAHALGFGQLLPQPRQVGAGAGQRLADGSTERGEDLRPVQMLDEVLQQPALERTSGDARGVAAACAAGGLGPAAPVAVCVHDHHRAAAFGTAQQPGQQVARAAARPPAPAVGRAVLPGLQARLGGIPGRSVDDGQLRMLADDPLLRWPLLPHPLAGVRVLDPA